MSNSLSLTLQGLTCANCANKIEALSSKVKGVETANVDIMKQEIKLDYETNIIDQSELIDQIKSIVKRLEPDVLVYEVTELSDAQVSTSNPSSSNIFEKYDLDIKNVASFILGILLFITALVINDTSYLSIGLFLAAYVLLGADVVIRAVKNIINGDFFDENFLMSIATIGAFCIQDYAEAVAVMIFYKIGEFFQDLAVNKSRQSIKDLMNIAPEYANIVTENGIKTVKPSQVTIGDIIIVKPGEKIPLDGVIVEGHAQIDASSLTGESLPQEVSSGEDVLSGCININGVIKIKVSSDYKDSTVVKIMNMVENASSRKADVEKFITRFSKIYTPIVVFAAIAIAVIPPLIMPGMIFTDWLHRALIFLVISCPCALVISVPLTFFSGIGSASKQGILVKGGNFLQILAEADIAVFDKTGTLTKGVFELTDIIPGKGFSNQDVLKTAYLLEKYSNHPIAKSVVNAYLKDNVQIDTGVTKYQEIAGYGLEAEVDGIGHVVVGNNKLMIKEGIAFEEYTGAGAVLYVAGAGNYYGHLVISDTEKDDSKDAISNLRAEGFKKIVMLSGDRKQPAEDIAKKLNIDTVYSELLPNEKIEKLEQLIENNPNSKILFVGDGINDAPALARADIGIAMGGVGSDAAIEAADVILMTDEPSKIVQAVKISKRTMKIAMQNIVFALAIKLVVLALGALGITTMWHAVFADVGVTLLVVLNTMRNR